MRTNHSKLGPAGVPPTEFNAVISAAADTWSLPFSLLHFPILATEIAWSRPLLADGLTLTPDVDVLLFVLTTLTPSNQDVRLATATALPACTAAGAGVGKTLTGNANGALSIDGTLTVAADIVLVKNQVTTIDNGIYTVTVVGTAGTPFVLTRNTAYDQAAELVAGTIFNVTAGGTLSGNKYSLGTTLLTGSWDIEVSNSYNGLVASNVAAAASNGFVKLVDVTTEAVADENFTLVNSTGLAAAWARVRMTRVSGAAKLTVRMLGKAQA